MSTGFPHCLFPLGYSLLVGFVICAAVMAAFVVAPLQDAAATKANRISAPTTTGE